ncbi:MAG: peptidoglycan DD-metalloendopeptidase family protein [Fluviicola sp.]
MNFIQPEQTSLVIDPSIPREAYLPLDLSVSNPKIAEVNASSSADWEQYINKLLKENGKKIAFGGYLEKRNIYQRSAYFKDAANNRNIHLGVDFWIGAGTSVHAFANGKVHSFQDNQNFGDYGPTIILEHAFNGQVFFSLYGHLSRESLNNISLGQAVVCGEKIAELGAASVNGDYAPHLHFQLIRDMEGKKGDYPGVCTESEVTKYKKNCPNPLSTLNLENLTL